MNAVVERVKAATDVPALLAVIRSMTLAQRHHPAVRAALGTWTEDAIHIHGIPTEQLLQLPVEVWAHTEEFGNAATLTNMVARVMVNTVGVYNDERLLRWLVRYMTRAAAATTLEAKDIDVFARQATRSASFERANAILRELPLYRTTTSAPGYWDRIRSRAAATASTGAYSAQAIGIVRGAVKHAFMNALDVKMVGALFLQLFVHAVERGESEMDAANAYHRRIYDIVQRRGPRVDRGAIHAMDAGVPPLGLSAYYDKEVDQFMKRVLQHRRAKAASASASASAPSLDAINAAVQAATPAGASAEFREAVDTAVRQAMRSITPRPAASAAAAPAGPSAALAARAAAATATTPQITQISEVYNTALQNAKRRGVSPEIIAYYHSIASRLTGPPERVRQQAQLLATKLNNALGQQGPPSQRATGGRQGNLDEIIRAAIDHVFPGRAPAMALTRIRNLSRSFARGGRATEANVNLLKRSLQEAATWISQYKKIIKRARAARVKETYLKEMDKRVQPYIDTGTMGPALLTQVQKTMEDAIQKQTAATNTARRTAAAQQGDAARYAEAFQRELQQAQAAGAGQGFIAQAQANFKTLAARNMLTPVHVKGLISQIRSAIYYHKKRTAAASAAAAADEAADASTALNFLALQDASAAEPPRRVMSNRRPKRRSDSAAADAALPNPKAAHTDHDVYVIDDSDDDGKPHRLR
jgi:hypothetical protein